MAIISAAIEANGWVLALTGTFGAGSFGDHVLDADTASPRVVVNCSHAGFVQSGGQAVAGSRLRAIAATKPLRLAVNPAAPSPAVIDEADLGGGLRRVRIALADTVYATDTGLTLDVAAGWRTGEGAASGLAVSNNSTVAAPVPIFRWAWYPFEVVGGVFRLSAVVFSHYPNGFQPVAGVRFTVTDGTNVKSYWATSLGHDNRAGDNLRCYTVEVDPATATALTAGQLRCDLEVYPWLGAMRSTDPAGTRDMADLRTVARGSGAQIPLMVAYDPAGDRYANMWVMLDPTGGSTTAAAGMVATNLAAARAVGTKARNISVAIQAAYLANRSLPAANGGVAITRSANGLTIVVPAGVEAEMGAQNVTSGLNNDEAFVRIIGDPEVSDPRTSCVVRSNNNTTAPPTLRVVRMLLKDLTVRLGQTRFSTGPGYVVVDNCEVNAKTGFEADSAATLTGFTPPTGQVSLAVVNARWWKTAVAMSASTQRLSLSRGCQWSRTIRGIAILTGRWIGPDDDTVGAQTPLGSYNVAADLGGCEDNIIAWNDMRRTSLRAVLFTLPTAATAGTTYSSLRRHVLIGNVFERVGAASPDPFLSIGEGQAVTVSYTIIEANSFVGERANFWYNDPPSASASVNSQLFCNRRANNAFDWNPTKHDDFLDGTYGYRPHLTGGWSALYGVMHEGNWDGVRAASSPGAFRMEFPGLRSAQTPGATNPLFADDRCVLAANTGGGDYRPGLGSPLLGRMLGGNTDRDLSGAARGAGSPAGALEAAPSGLMLAPVPVGHGMTSGAPGLVTSVGLVPAGARHGHLAGGGLLMAGAGLAPGASLLPGRASTTALLLSVAVLPLPATHLLSSGGPELAAGGLVLAPGAGGHGLMDMGTLLSVPAVTLGARVLRPGADMRTGFARAG